MGFGIAGLVLAIGANVAPIGFNLVALWLALACATLAAPSNRGIMFVAAIWLASASAILFLSPQTLAALFGALPNKGPAAAQVGTAALYVTLIAFAAPVLALLARRRARQPKSDDAMEPALQIASAPAPSDASPPEPAPTRGEITLPSPRVRSALGRALLLVGLALGAAGVVFFLRDLDRTGSAERAQPANEAPARSAM